jgi:GT2 family glycosyltransferase
MATERTAVVVVTYNGAPWLERCLKSVCNGERRDVIVVDNNSTDTSANIAASFPQVTLVRQDTNLGFGRANNIGIGIALSRGADFVLLLNQDAWLEASALSTLIARMRTDQRLGIVSPLHLTSDGRDFDPIFLNGYLRSISGRILWDALMAEPSSTYTVESVNAAVWLMSAACLRTAGGFDPTFFMYGEDDDLCRRVRYHGFQIAIVPRAIAYHSRGFHDRSGETFRRRLRRISGRVLSDMIVQAKDPTGDFTKNWMRAGKGHLRSAVESRDLAEAFGTTSGLWRFALTWSTIRAHRKRSLIAGSHWIPHEPSSKVQPAHE